MMWVITAGEKLKMNLVIVTFLFGVFSTEMRRALVGWSGGDIRSSVSGRRSLSCFLEIQIEMFNKQLGKLFKSLQEIQTGEINVGVIGEQVLFKPGKSLDKWDRKEDQGLSQRHSAVGE